MLEPAAFIFGGAFVKPLTKLSKAVERAGKGNLDFKINLKTGDEIEELAEAFNKMTDNLKKTTVSRDNKKKKYGGGGKDGCPKSLLPRLR
ncbi:HAMP domain-containing protein [Candidatus Omnitrophota bacterium]